ncbi:hypothetical protein DNO_1219 [Dichelobacter nodosus VCS1703A]|uniref:Uncharacterized protein n=1 Tax=Dichelobacter nodosus (strain VCS1703A) TaxID=246195 RepID=A5EXD2_DICNV|nr:hypothetical protein DNO_1219 [Dichelobacter nodosus VCS1703A]
MNQIYFLAAIMNYADKLIISTNIFVFLRCKSAFLKKVTHFR